MRLHVTLARPAVDGRSECWSLSPRPPYDPAEGEVTASEETVGGKSVTVVA